MFTEYYGGCYLSVVPYLSGVRALTAKTNGGAEAGEGGGNYLAKQGSTPCGVLRITRVTLEAGMLN